MPSEWGKVRFLWGGQATARPGYLFAITKKRRAITPCIALSGYASMKTDGAVVFI
ncbi:MAG TPA: hypothetical protein VHO66_08560 [Ruminiclostridium sp.]|nr:hypothetical protein [Ruminiclostridium sp.]